MNGDQPVRMPRVAMREVITSLYGALAAQVGSADAKLVQTLRSRGFDGAPVLDAEEKLIGFVPTPLLAELAADGQHLTVSTPGLWTKRLGAEPTVDELLRFTLDQPAGIVQDESDQAIGFFTLSDLNRHPVRAAIYPLFAELESELAILIESRFSEPWDWIKLVPEHRQPALVGYWKISERNEVDIGPISAAMLSELGSVVGAHPQTLNDLGFVNIKKWKKFFNGINEQRHSIMHPVRPMVTGLEDLDRLLRRVERIVDLIQRVTKLTGRVRGVSS